MKYVYGWEKYVEEIKKRCREVEVLESIESLSSPLAPSST